MRTQLLTEQNKASYYLQIKEIIKEGIRKGDILDGNRLPTVRELSETYKVSPTTTGKAIDSLRKEGVLFARPRKGIFLSPKARRILEVEKNRCLSLGLVFWDVFNLKGAYLQEVYRGIMDFATEKNVNISIIPIHGDDTHLSNNQLLLDNLKEKRTQGMILASRLPLEDIATLKREKIPFVWLDNDIPFEKINCVLFDDLYAINLALKHFTSKGLKRVGVVEFWWEETLFSAFLDMLEDKKLDTDSRLIKRGLCYSADEEINLAHEKTIELLDQNIQGILTTGIETLTGTLKAISERGLEVGKDIELVSICPCSEPSHFLFSIPRIELPVREGTKKAGEMLMELITKGETNPAKVIMKPRFIKEPGYFIGKDQPVT